MAQGLCGLGDIACDACGPVAKPPIDEGNPDSAGNNTLAPPTQDVTKPFDPAYVAKLELYNETFIGGLVYDIPRDPALSQLELVYTATRVTLDCVTLKSSCST